MADLTGDSKVSDDKNNKPEIIPLDDIRFREKIDFIKMYIGRNEIRCVGRSKRFNQKILL